MESDSALSARLSPLAQEAQPLLLQAPSPSSAFNIEPGTSCSRAPALVNSKKRAGDGGLATKSVPWMVPFGAGLRVQPQGPSKCSPVQLVTAEMRSFPEPEMPLLVLCELMKKVRIIFVFLSKREDLLR